MYPPDLFKSRGLLQTCSSGGLNFKMFTSLRNLWYLLLWLLLFGFFVEGERGQGFEIHVFFQALLVKYAAVCCT